MISYTDGRAKDQQLERRATTSSQKYKFKVAVLINRGTASGAELIAAALQDHDRGLVFGAKSFVRCSVQTIIPLEDGSGMRLTNAHFFTPKARKIQGVGIQLDMDLTTSIKKKTSEKLPISKQKLC
jgi:carboxyl-terminal processing protease